MQKCKKIGKRELFNYSYIVLKLYSDFFLIKFEIFVNNDKFV